MDTRHWTRREILAVSGVVGLTALGAPLSLAAAATYEHVVFASHPVAYWRLGEATGPEAQDRTRHGHTGIFHGTPRFQERGAIQGDANTAIALDGRSSYLEIASHPAFSQPTSGKGLTVEVWMRPDVLDFAGETAEPYIVWLGKGEAHHQEWALRFYSRTSPDRPNRLSAYLFNPEGGLGAGAYCQDELTVGEWLHLVACFDPGDARTPGAGVRLYKNGVLRQGPPAPGTLYHTSQWQITSVPGPAPLRLGTRDFTSFLTGGLDEVAIYPRVLTVQEIGDHYATGRRRGKG